MTGIHLGYGGEILKAGNINSESEEFPFRWFEQKNGTGKLAIVLPGAGYTTQAPLLRYSTQLFYKEGFDVLHINYTLSKEEMAVLNEKEFARKVEKSITKAIRGRNYSHYSVAAKSVGTLALSQLLANLDMLKDAKLLWLTPLLQRDEVFQAMVNRKNEGLCIIGENDRHCFIPERVETLRNQPNLSVKLVDGGNHSLEIEGDPIRSIGILKEVISEIQQFVV